MHVLCASSDYEQLAAICDRVIVFGRGRDLARARRRRGDEGADHRAVLRRDGRRGRGGRRVTSRRRGRRAAAAPEPLAAPTRLERYALLVVWGVTCVVFGILRPGHVPDDVELHDDLRLAGDPRRADAGAARPADRRRLRPLGRGDDGALGDDARDPERATTAGRSARRSSPRSASGSLVGARQRRARRAARHRLADRDARHVDVHRRASCSGSATRRRSAASPTG